MLFGKRGLEMGKRPKKQIVLFLVEGLSERNALWTIMSELYEKIDENAEVFFCQMEEDGVVGGDITSRNGVTPEKIEMLMHKLVVGPLLDKENIYPKDVTEIIQIVDLDGAYIPDENVVFPSEPLSEEHPVMYYADRIEANNVQGIRNRNLRKRANIDYLCSRKEIKVKTKTVPYSVYYMSCNLDTFLHRETNIPTGREKCDKAAQFYSQFDGDAMLAAKFFINDQDVAHGRTYEESWAYIRQGYNSLRRFSNINLLCEKLLTMING